MKTINAAVKAIASLGFFLISLSVFADPATDLPRFFEVVPGQVYRGAQPTISGIKMLAQMNIKTIIDLRGDDSLRPEEQLAKQLGFNFISVPLSGFWRPKDADMAKIENALNDPSLRPIFIHCQQGEDRTGLSIGLYRIFSQGWTPEAAWKEMELHGFHSILRGLKEYFEDKSGYDP